MAVATARIIAQNGVFYAFDSSRNKFLSTSRAYYSAAVKSRNVTNQFLRVEDGTPMQPVGNMLPRNGTIVGLTVNTEATHTWALEIYKKGTVSPVATFSITANSKAKSENLNVDVSADDILQVKAVGSNITYPRVIIEIAWRL